MLCTNWNEIVVLLIAGDMVLRFLLNLIFHTREVHMYINYRTLQQGI